MGPFAFEWRGCGAFKRSAARCNRQASSLRDLIDETIVLSVWSSHGPIILEVEESTRPIVMTMKRGTALPVLSTATGIVFCAALPRFHTSALIERELSGEVQSDPIVKSMKELEELLVRVREQGYALNAGHLLPDIIALAAPAFDPAGSLAAVLGVIGRGDPIDPRSDDRILKALLSVTRRSR